MQCEDDELSTDTGCNVARWQTQQLRRVRRVNKLSLSLQNDRGAG